MALLGITETKWSNLGNCITKSGSFFYFGNNNKEHRNEVETIFSRELAQKVIIFAPYSDRTIFIKIRGKSMNINAIQTYAPISGIPNSRLRIRTQVEYNMKLTKKFQINTIMGEFKAKVGKEPVSEVVG